METNLPFITWYGGTVPPKKELRTEDDSRVYRALTANAGIASSIVMALSEGIVSYAR